MGFNLYDINSFFEEKQRENNYYKLCLKKYKSFNECFLEISADQFLKKDWNNVSYFANLTTEFVNSFKNELNPTLLRMNKNMNSEIKKHFLIFLEGSSNEETLLLSKNQKLKIKIYPASWFCK